MFMIRGVLPEHPRNQLSQRLALHLLRQTEETPNAANAAFLAQQLGVSLTILNNGAEYRSPGALAGRDDIVAALEANPDRVSFEAMIAGQNYFILRDGDRVYAIGNFVTDLSQVARLKLLAGAVLIPILLLVAFLLVRRTVAPLAPLSDALRLIGKGDLEQRVSPRGWGEINRLERMVNEMASALERSQRAKQEMLIAIGHEFSSPIARMMFQAERIEDATLRSKMTDNLMRINLLFRTLISVETLTGDDEGKPPARERFPDVIRDIADAAAEGRAILDLPARQCNLLIDRIRLELLLNNFISNALRYAPNSPIEIAADHAYGVLTLVVSDRGPGVSEEFIAEMGEPFKREDKSHRFQTDGGLGLGLFLCGRIVSRAGGKLRIRNRETGGLEVRVDWPCEARPL